MSQQQFEIDAIQGFQRTQAVVDTDDEKQIYERLSTLARRIELFEDRKAALELVAFSYCHTIVKKDKK